MKLSSLLKMALLISAGWLALLGASLYSDWTILRNASGYRPAELLVASGHCTGGQRSRSGTTDPRYCFLKGDILVDGNSTGQAEELSVGSTLPAKSPPGTRLKVFYNAAQQPFTVNYHNLRILPADEYGPDVARAAVRNLRFATWIMQLSVGTLFAVHLGLWWGIRHWSRPPHQLALDLGGSRAMLVGVFLFSQGLTFLVAQYPNPAWGGVVFGLVLAGIGAPFLIRRFAVFSRDDGRMIRGRHLFSVAFGREERPLSSIKKVALREEGNRVAVALDVSPGSETLATFESLPPARKLGADIAAYLGVGFRDPSATSPQG